MNDALVNTSLALALGSLALFAGSWLLSARALQRLGTAGVVATLAALTATIVHRWIGSGRAPFANLYEAVLLFAWSAGATALLMRFAFRAAEAEPVATLTQCLALAYASLLDASTAPLVPALRSNWLLIHVTTTIVAYGAFALAFGAAVWHLARRRKDAQGREPAAEAAARSAALGFAFLTVGIATGAIWARQAWGSYWGWDPKETWSLITWLVYASFLHLRFARGWKSAAASWFLVGGFAAVLFTFFGVSSLMKGLHSYG